MVSGGVPVAEVEEVPSVYLCLGVLDIQQYTRKSDEKKNRGGDKQTHEEGEVTTSSEQSSS